MGRTSVPAALVAALAGLLLGAGQAVAYDVKPGDTLWAISRRTGVPVDQIVPGQHLVVGGAPPPAAAGQLEAVRGEAARQILIAAAHEFGLNPNFVLAVSLWESGQNQAEVSKDGAIGLMQIMPGTARWAGP